MRAVNNSILLRMNSLPDLKVENRKVKDEIETKPNENASQLYDVERSGLSVPKLYINRAMSTRNPRTKHMVNFS
jgi:hypothetical protein